MNKYVRASVVVPFTMLKIGFTKLFHLKEFFVMPSLCMLSPFSEVSLDRGGKLFIGRMLKMRDGSKLRVRKGAICKIGNNTSMGSNSMVVCHESISIGDNVQISPNVQIYDHDHDFRHSEGLKANHFICAPVVIGDNVWIGANTIILRGTTIGNNCVIGAGCVIKGEFPTESVIIQKRNTSIV